MTWTIPNVLTTLRLLAAPGVVVMFLYFTRPWADWFALVLFIVARDHRLVRRLPRAALEAGVEVRRDARPDRGQGDGGDRADRHHRLLRHEPVDPAAGDAHPLPRGVRERLREFLGAAAGRLQVTKLAKWKTTAQMVAIAVLFLGTGLDFIERGRGPKVGGLAGLSDGLAGWATFAGICCCGSPRF
jgi:cardiolipin synthase (CMP-forming)